MYLKDPNVAKLPISSLSYLQIPCLSAFLGKNRKIMMPNNHIRELMEVFKFSNKEEACLYTYKPKSAIKIFSS